jgi:DNA-binding NarL/FixJ family response regulator
MAATVVWVYSPHALINAALSTYFQTSGYAVAPGPEGAHVAVFDLTALERPVLPAPSLPTIALVRHEDSALLHDLRRLGYRGVQCPSHDAATIRHIVDTVAGGGTSGFDACDVALPPPSPGAHREVVLTTRQAQVLSLLMLGLPNKRIASRLGITERTVKHYVSMLLRLYRVGGRSGLILHARTYSHGTFGYQDESPTSH